MRQSSYKPSEICGRQPLKNFTRSIHEYFSPYAEAILRGPFDFKIFLMNFNTLGQSLIKISRDLPDWYNYSSRVVYIALLPYFGWS